MTRMARKTNKTRLRGKNGIDKMDKEYRQTNRETNKTMAVTSPLVSVTPHPSMNV